MKFFLPLMCICISLITSAQMPTEQVTQFAVKDTFAWKVNIQIKVPTTSDSALVVISKNDLSSLTLNKQFYGIGQNIVPGAKVYRKFFKGSSTFTFTIFGLDANTTYNLAFYTYNNNANGIFYSNTPLKVNFKTKGKSFGNYYKTLDTNKAVFLSSLASLLQIRQHDSVDWYTNFRDIVPETYERDTFYSNKQEKYVVCDYSDKIATYNANAALLGSINFSREHTLPKNWMNFRGIPNPDLVKYKEGSDWHNLSLVETNVNSARIDYIHDIPTQNITNYSQARLGKRADGKFCFEPKDSYKGNTARCVFFTQLCYNNTTGAKWGFKNGLKSYATDQNQEIYKTWARTDTVDNFEIARHECIAYYQKNRNPFIDFPDWIDCIDFNDLHLLKSCSGLKVDSIPKVNIQTQLKSEWDVWYYPYSTDEYILKMYYDKVAPIRIEILDIKGKAIYTENQRVNEGENSFNLHPPHLSPALYFIHIVSNERERYLKLLVE